MKRVIRWMVKLFVGVAVASVLLALTEAALRFFDIARPPAFLSVRSTPAGDRLSINPAYIGRFFKYQPMSRARMMERTPWRREFSREKRKDTLRVVALGESSTQGYPHAHRLSFPKIAEGMLRVRHPEKRFEIINAGVVAINSFAILDIGRRLIDEARPAAILVYAGHNEFHGIFGAASPATSALSGRAIRALIGLWNLHLYTLIERAYFSALEKWRGRDAIDAPMKVLAEGRYVRPGDAAHRRAKQNFRENLELLIAHATAANIPVVLIPPVSNLKDMPPLASFSMNGRPTEIRSEAVAFLNELRARGPADEFLKRADARIESDSSAALWRYYRGHAQLAAKNSPEAKREFLNALEMDGLHFRACTEIVEIVRSMADSSIRPSGSVAHVVDPWPAFAQFSAGGIPGNELFYEHVHPTTAGNLLLAWSAVLGVEKVLGLQSRAPEFPNAVYARTFLQFDVDWFVSSAKILRLLDDWPFSGRPEMEELRARARRIKDESWSRMDKIVRSLIAPLGPDALKADEVILYAKIGRAYLESDSPAKALAYLEVADEDTLEEPDIASHLGVAWMMLKQPARARPVLERARTLDPGNAVTRLNLGGAYFSEKRLADAASEFREALRLDPAFSDARLRLALILLMEKNPAPALRELAMIPRSDPGARGRAEELLARFRPYYPDFPLALP